MTLRHEVKSQSSHGIIAESLNYLLFFSPCRLVLDAAISPHLLLLPSCDSLSGGSSTPQCAVHPRGVPQKQGAPRSIALNSLNSAPSIYLKASSWQTFISQFLNFRCQMGTWSIRVWFHVCLKRRESTFAPRMLSGCPISH